MGVCSSKQTTAHDGAHSATHNVNYHLFKALILYLCEQGVGNGGNGVVNDIGKFTISSKDFISENTGRFREFYSIGSALGTGTSFILKIQGHLVKLESA